MSGDESDSNHRPGHYRGQANYFRIRPVWRAPCVSSWLDVIDKVYVAFRFQQNNRATPGNWIRKRHTTNRVDEKATVVSGLPGNFYDGDWLKTLTRKQRRKLQMEPPLNLTHTPHIMRYVGSQGDQVLACLLGSSGLPYVIPRWKTGRTSPLKWIRRKTTSLKVPLFDTRNIPNECEYYMYGTDKEERVGNGACA